MVAPCTPAQSASLREGPSVGRKVVLARRRRLDLHDVPRHSEQLDSVRRARVGRARPAVRAARPMRRSWLQFTERVQKDVTTSKSSMTRLHMQRDAVQLTSGAQVATNLEGDRSSNDARRWRP